MNHYSLVSSPGILHNQDLIIEQEQECSPTILLVLPDQEMVLRFVAPFWEWVRQRAIERRREKESETEREGEWRDEMNRRSTFPLPHACCSPCRVTGVLASVVLQKRRNVSRAFNLASKEQGSKQRCKQLCFRFAHEAGCCFSLNLNTYPITDCAEALSDTSFAQHSKVHLQQGIIRECDFSQ